MKRIPYDLGFHSDCAGRMGSLMTLGFIPVLGGDSISVNAEHIFRLSPLRRSLLHDGQVDLFAFYTPWRHTYGADWISMIKQGTDSSGITLPVLASGATTSYTGQVLETGAGSVSKWVYSSYNQIWNRYFRFLKLTPEVPDDYIGVGYPSGHTTANSPIDGTLVVREYGFPCARLKRPWSTGIVQDIVAADHEVAAASSKFDLLDLYKQQQIYKTQITREWFSIRYTDVMKSVFGSGVNADVDERPTLIMRKTYSLSGRDVDGTDDASLGSHVSKSVNRFPFSFRRKFIPEHGVVHLMCLVRFPTIVEEEMHPIIKGNQDYLRMSGDYNLTQSQEPIETFVNEWQVRGPNVTLGFIPFGQQWRTQPNFVHKKYADLTGFQFLKESEVDKHREVVYSDPNDYDSVFSSKQLGHWQSQSTIQVEAMRHFPPAVSSLYAGTK